jgi:hypothetical protein
MAVVLSRLAAIISHIIGRRLRIFAKYDVIVGSEITR